MALQQNRHHSLCTSPAAEPRKPLATVQGRRTTYFWEEWWLFREGWLCLAAQVFACGGGANPSLHTSELCCFPGCAAALEWSLVAKTNPLGAELDLLGE